MRGRLGSKVGVLWLACWLGACAGPRSGVRDAGALGGQAGVVALDGQGGEPLSAEAAWERLREARHVYVGEQHGSALHHRAQLAVARFLAARGASLAIGVEWLSVDTQPVLEQWLRGEVDDAAFVKAVGWKRVTGHPFESYAPILRWARETGVPLVALNAPAGLTRKLVRQGEEGLSEGERAQLTPRDSGNPAHRAYFDELMRGAIGSHGGPALHLSAEEVAAMGDRYYEAQLVWDETMAAGVARLLEAPGRIALVFAGRGHVQHALGIPQRAQTLTGAPFAVVLPVPAGDGEAAAGLTHAGAYPERHADLLWQSQP